MVDFNAPWCTPCRLLRPTIDRLTRRYGDQIRVVDLNVDEAPQSAMQSGITSIPTLIIYKDGKELRRFVGFQSEKTLTEALETVLHATKRR